MAAEGVASSPAAALRSLQGGKPGRPPPPRVGVAAGGTLRRWARGCRPDLPTVWTRRGRGGVGRLGGGRAREKSKETGARAGGEAKCARTRGRWRGGVGGRGTGGCRQRLTRRRHCHGHGSGTSRHSTATSRRCHLPAARGCASARLGAAGGHKGEGRGGGEDRTGPDGAQTTLDATAPAARPSCPPPPLDLHPLAAPLP